MNDKTLLLRQAHPQFIIEGHMTSQAFTPFPKDEGLLSVYDGDLIGSSAAYHHYTEILQFQSAGVWGMKRAEAESTNLICRPDPLENFAEHTVIDFSSHSPKAIRKLAKRLRDLAVARGCLYAPDAD